MKYTQIFENFFLGNFRSIWLSSQNFRNFRLYGSLFGNSTVSLFSETFSRKFPYHLSPIRKFRNFWSNCKRPKCQSNHHCPITKDPDNQENQSNPKHIHEADTERGKTASESRLHLRLPHTSRLFVVELQIFCRGQIGFKFVGTSACRTLADFFVATNRV